jgi:hypothetical protein
VTLHRLRVEGLEHAARRIAGVARSGQGDVVATGIHHDVEPAFHQSEVLAVGADQRGGGTVVVEIDDDLRLGLYGGVKFAGSERRRIRCAFGQEFRLP